MVLFVAPLVLLGMQSKEANWWALPFLGAIYGMCALAVLRRLTVVVAPPEEDGLERALEVAQQEAELLAEELQVRAAIPVDKMEEEIIALEEKITVRDEKIAQLEGKVHDLTYEIRTLLKLETAPPQELEAVSFEDETWVEEALGSSSGEVESQYDAYILLQRCIQKAQGIGAAHASRGQMSLFQKLPLESYALDKRRLFDAFRMETSAVVFLYSTSDRRPLFVNNVVQAYCGLEPEHFLREFSKLARTQDQKWEEAMANLEANREVVIALGMGSATLHCCMGLVPSGPFEGLVIGVGYPANRSIA